ncbi:MAG: hypothetical protein M1835_000134 [Candelina submexicana]|nr:MAG: hypothetical protein M1835_000134 [Candelina submexicana]
MTGFVLQQQFGDPPSVLEPRRSREPESHSRNAPRKELTPPWSPWNRFLGRVANNGRKPNPLGTIGQRFNRPSAAGGAGRLPFNKTDTIPKDFNISVTKPRIAVRSGISRSLRNPKPRFFPADTKSNRAQALERLFRGSDTPAPAEASEPTNRGPHSPAELPPEFKQRLENEKLWARGRDDEIIRYYAEDMSRYDSRRIPGRGGNPSLLEDILKAGAAERLNGLKGPGWRPVRDVGQGGQGLVTLWEYRSEEGEVYKLVTKDLGWNSWFEDYSNEAQYTKRLNDRGCQNVINVIEWTALPNRKMRVAYEFAEHGDLYEIKEFYEKYGLKIPEPFIWHVFHSMALALSYCHLGHADTTPIISPDWEEILHADLKEENILMLPPTSTNPYYPHLKLADFGLSFTVPNQVVRTFKSTRWHQYGTPGYQAPEITMHNRQNTPPHLRHRMDRRDLYPDHGPHTDIYALGKTIDSLISCAFRKNFNASSAQTEVLQVYSEHLLQLTRSCLRLHGADRITTTALLQETSKGCAKARLALEHAHQYTEWPGGVYEGRLLYTKAEREMFKENAQFRTAYLAMDRVPSHLLAPDVKRTPPPSIPSRAQGRRRYVGNDEGRTSSRGRGGMVPRWENPPAYDDWEESLDSFHHPAEPELERGGSAFGRERGRTDEELRQFEGLKMESFGEALAPPPPKRERRVGEVLLGKRGRRGVRELDGVVESAMRRKRVGGLR